VAVVEEYTLGVMVVTAAVPWFYHCPSDSAIKKTDCQDITDTVCHINFFS
jgi:hypothetical protein